MGREIVYCEGCGNSLREDDFERGRARLIDNRPFCTECRPYREGEAPKRSSSGKVPAPPPRKTSTGHIPILPPPARRPQSGPGPKASSPLPLVAGVGAVLFILLIYVVTQGGTPKPAVVVEAPPPPPPVVIPRPVARPPDPPPPPPPMRREPAPSTSKPSDPLVAPTASEKLDAFLGQIRQIIQTDTRVERSEEIVSMFAAARKTAGARAAEVDKMKADYLAGLDPALRGALTWAEWKITSSADPAQTELMANYDGRVSVYRTHPLDRNTPSRLEREVEIPAGKKTTLHFWVACHEKGDFELRVFADGKALLKEMIGPKGSGWKEKSVDLTPLAGKKIALRLENFPNDWEWEHAYWSDLAITSE